MLKKRMLLFLGLSFSIVLFSCPPGAAQSPSSSSLEAPSGLMCDLMAHSDYQSIHGYPIQTTWDTAAFLDQQAVTIASRHPSFSWILEDTDQNVLQTAYQILVSDHLDSLKSDQGTLWNSAEARSSLSSGIAYRGKPLRPHTLYYWKVRVWDNLHQESAYSPISAFFTDSILHPYATPTYPIEKSDEYPEKLQTSDGTILADFGRDAFGQLKLRLFSQRPNDTVTLSLGETLGPDGHINPRPGGTIRFSSYRLPLMRGWHTYRTRIPRNPRNTGPVAILMPHYIGEVTPFRYAELTGYAHPLTPQDFIRAAVHYPFDDEAADFHCSDSLLNAVWDLCKYTMKATSFAGTFVDGDRERTPYEADAYINQLGYYAVDREYSIARHTLDFLITHANWPTEWILMTPLLAWNDYLYTGNPKAITHHYAQLKLKTLTTLEGPDGLISTRTHLQTPQLLKSLHLTKQDSLTDIVDWPQARYLASGQYLRGATDGFIFEPYNSVINAFYYKSLLTMEAVAKVTGHRDDAADFARRARRVKQQFQRKFWDHSHKRYVDGIGTTHASLHANMFAMAFGLVPHRYQKDVLSFVRSRGMQCSVYGSQFLLEAVYEQGDGAYGQSLMTSREKRSWYNMLASGSTLTMEAWGQSLKSNLDLNHAWGAAPANIIPRYLVGIRPTEPGWSEFTLQPQPGDLTEVRATVSTIKGPVVFSYLRDRRGYKVNVIIPAGTKADVSLPRFGKSLHQIAMDDRRIRVRRVNESFVIGKVGSGKHTFEVRF